MQDFLLLYAGGDPKWMENQSPDEMQAAMAKWGAWFQELEKSGAIKDPGNALLPGGKVVATGGVVTDASMSEIKELIGGYSIVRAETAAQAAEIAKGSPHLDAPDTRVLVRRIMPEMG